MLKSMLQTDLLTFEKVPIFEGCKSGESQRSKDHTAYARNLYIPDLQNPTRKAKAKRAVLDFTSSLR